MGVNEHTTKRGVYFFLEVTACPPPNIPLTHWEQCGPMSTLEGGGGLYLLLEVRASDHQHLSPPLRAVRVNEHARGRGLHFFPEVTASVV